MVINIKEIEEDRGQGLNSTIWKGWPGIEFLFGKVLIVKEFINQ